MLVYVELIKNVLFESVSICTGMASISMNYSCLDMACMSTDMSAKAMTSADITERATRPDLYDLYDIIMTFLVSSATRTMRSNCKQKLMKLILYGKN